MESLYRKYRPLTFESVVGQQHIVSTLEHAVTEGRLSHAYLFCGPRGTGKTTMARILAKALLCEKVADAPAGTGCLPDGTCEECEAIAAGTHPDVYELDAASRTGVDSVREEIVNSVSFAPVRGKYKVYIIDEVHMLSTAAFNALLKTLEEPPAHVVFVLCTTDPQKVLPTILSRCQRFDFHRISDGDLVSRMRYVCEQEGFEADDEALEIVARHARGGMRDALSTLEQLSVFGDGAVRVSDARSLLGEVPSAVLGEFTRSIAGRDVVALFGLVRTQVEEGNDLLELTRDLVAHVRDVYTVKVAGTEPGLVEGAPEEVAALAEEASRFEDGARLARVLTTLDDAALRMRDAADMRLVLEIACTRLARPKEDLTIEALAERLDRLEARVSSGVVAPPAVAPPVASPTAPFAATPMGSAPAASASMGRHPSASARAVPAPDAPASSGRSASEALPWEKGSAAAHVPAVSDPHAAPSSRAPHAPKSPQPAVSTVPVPSATSSARPSGTRSFSPVHPRRPATSAAQVAAAGAAPTPAVTDPGELQRKWAEVVERVGATKASRKALMLSSRARSDDGSTLVVGLPAKSDFAYKMLTRPDAMAVVLPVVCAVFGSRELVYAMDGGPDGDAAAPSAPRRQDPGAASGPVAPASPGAPSGVAGKAVSPAYAETVPSAPVPESGAAMHPAPAGAPVPAAPASDAVAAPSSNPARMSEEVPAPSSASPADVPPWEGASSSPAPVPLAQGPAERPSEGATDQVSGPTVVPEPDVDADRRAWEDEQVPYDDATVASYEADEPPFEPPAPAAPTSNVHVPSPSPSSVGSPAAAPVSMSATPPAASFPVPATPPAAAGDPPASPAGMPWATHPSVADELPQSPDEAKAMLSDIFGAATVFSTVPKE